MLELMQSVIEEVDNIDDEMFDAIFSNLVDPSKAC